MNIEETLLAVQALSGQIVYLSRQRKLELAAGRLDMAEHYGEQSQACFDLRSKLEQTLPENY